MVAATLDGGDRLWADWQHFDRSESPQRILPRAALDEFSEVVEGVGPRNGLLDQMLSDCLSAIRGAGGNRPDDGALRAMGLDGNRLQRTRRMIDGLAAAVRGGRDSAAALQALRQFEADFYVRKRDFLTRHQTFDPANPVECERVQRALEPIVPGGGMSWRWDCRVVAQASRHAEERRVETSFVTEDHRHFDPHVPVVLRLTRLAEIRDLRGNPLGRFGNTPP